MTSEEKESHGSLLSVVDLMHVCVNPGNLPAFIKSVTGFFKQHTGCHAVGVRLREGEDFPYYETQGFPPDFVFKENKLCAVDPAGELIRDSHNNPVIECMCGTILCGRTDPSMPFFTPHGSFWTGRISELFSKTTEAGRQFHIRNRCGAAGYETVLLIPLRWQGETFGLCQFNDKRKDYFKAAQIVELEAMAECAAITVAKLASEATLRKSEEVYRGLLTHLDAGVVVHAADTSVVMCNPRASELLGLTESQIKGKRAVDPQWEFVDEKNTPLPLANYPVNRIIADKKPIKDQLVGIRHSVADDIVWVMVNGFPMLDDKGQISEVLISFVDISERKRANEELKESEEKFRTFLDEAVEMLFVHDLEGNLIEVNRAAVLTTGYTRKQLLKMKVYDIDPDADTRGDQKHIWKALPFHTSRQFEVRHRRKDGSVYWAEVRAGKLLLKGKPYILALANDVTERKKAKEERETFIKTLQSKNEEMDNILFIAAHDLRGPLVNVQGFAGELEKSVHALRGVLSEVPLSDSAREKLNILLKSDIPESLRFIKDGSQMMNTLLSGLLRLSRIGTTDGQQPANIDINALIANICKTLRFKIQQGNVDIKIDGTLPACYGDATLITQVFANLIDNAIKYRCPDRPCRIRIRGSHKAGQSLYRIEDNGIGIAPENKDKIFELFHQLNPGAGGEGVGLTIVRRVLERQNGKIEIDSQLGTGTMVSIMLPSAE